MQETINQMSMKDAGVQFIKSVCSRHLGANIRIYRPRVTVLELNSSVWGHSMEKDQFEGNVVDENESFFLIKESAKILHAVDKALIKDLTSFKVGDKVKLTPYQRREYNGKVLGAPVETVSPEGYRSTVTIIGADISYLPIDKKSIQSEFLKDFVKQVEHLKMPDGIRTIAQAMIDYGSLAGDVSFVDPTDDDIFKKPPAISFKVNTQKAVGSLTISYDRALDMYNIHLIKTDNTTTEIAGVTFNDVGAEIAFLVDDGEWKFIKVDVLKSVKLKKSA